jgi:transcriptional regulator with XRE-family HTH domain
LNRIDDDNPESTKKGALMIGDEDGLNDPWSSGMIDLATQEAVLRAVGDLLRQVRLASGLKLGELAEQCDISQSVLCRVELARRYPGFMMLSAICARLGIRLSDLFRAAEDAAVPDIPATRREGRFHELLGNLNQDPIIWSGRGK